MLGVIVSLQYSHQVQGRDTSLFVRVNRFLNLGEITPFFELSLLCVDFCVLIVYLHFVENVISHSPCMHNEAALRKLTSHIVLMLIIVVRRGSHAKGLEDRRL